MPHSLSLKRGDSATLHAVVYDQFGQPMHTQPAKQYRIARGLGRIDPTDGLFTASIWPGPVVIQARSDSLRDIVEVDVRT